MADSFEFALTDAGPCRKSLRVTVPADRVRHEIEEAYRSLSQGARIPGFRPGKVPRAVLEKRYAEPLMREVKETLVQTGFRDALRSNDLTPLGSPELDLEEARLEPGQPFEFEVAFDVRPRVELPDLTGLAVEPRPVSVSEAEIDEAVAALRQGNRRVEPEEAAGVGSEGLALAKVEYACEGATVLVRDSVRLSPVAPIPGADPGAFEGALRGRKKGETFEVDVEFRPGFEAAAVVGKKGKARVTVLEVYRLVEPSDEELARALDFEGVAAFREDLVRRMRERKEEFENRRIEDEAIAWIAERAPFDLPERIVESETTEGIRRYQAHLEAQGIPEEEVAAQVAARRARSREDAARAIRAWFLIEAYARRAKVFVTEDDLRGEFGEIARRNGVPPDEVRRYYEEHGEIAGALKAELLERKVRRALRERSRGAAAATPT